MPAFEHQNLQSNIEKYLQFMQKLELYWIWLFKIRPERDLARFRNSNLAGTRCGKNLFWNHRTGTRYGKNLFWNHRTIHLIKQMTSTMLSAAVRVAVQFGASFVTSLFASFWWNLWHSNGICMFIVRVALIKTANTPLDRSAALF